jgi:hypothetical protein
LFPRARLVIVEKINSFPIRESNPGCSVRRHFTSLTQETFTKGHTSVISTLRKLLFRPHGILFRPLLLISLLTNQLRALLFLFIHDHLVHKVKYSFYCKCEHNYKPRYSLFAHVLPPGYARPKQIVCYLNLEVEGSKYFTTSLLP